MNLPAPSSVTRRRFIQGVGGASLGMALGRTELEAAGDANGQQPNFLILQPDQHRGTIMSCAGDKQIKTPHLDQLAADGIRFTRCISPSPVCSPCRATFQTGVYWHTHGVDRNNKQLDARWHGFAESLAAADYATGYTGKWHIDGGYGDEAGKPMGVVPEWHRRGWQEWHGYEKGHEYFKVLQPNNQGSMEEVPGYSWEPTYQTDLALDFIKRNQRKPWAYYVSFGPPHQPEECPQDYRKMFPPKSFQLSPDLVGRFDAEHEASLRQSLQCYYGQVTALDHEVGRLCQGLKDLGLDQSTVVVYMSDHGDMLGSHCAPNQVRRKATPYWTAFRTPMIVRWPERIKAGQVSDALVSNVDFAPTILSLAGLPVLSQMQGKSFADLCLGKTGTAREAVYLGLGGAGGEDGWRGVWDGRYIYSLGEYHILYDHKEDPHEQRNLIDDPEHADLRNRMNALLLKLAAETGDLLLPKLRTGMPVGKKGKVVG